MCRQNIGLTIERYEGVAKISFNKINLFQLDLSYSFCKRIPFDIYREFNYKVAGNLKRQDFRQQM